MSADPLEGRERARQEFEKVIQDIGLPITRDSWGRYESYAVMVAYDAWQARGRSIEQERWISVEERLPKLEHGGVGLCPCLFYAESTEKQFGGYYDPIYNDWLIATEDESRRLQVMDVSHWRPRPAPPVHKGDL